MTYFTKSAGDSLRASQANALLKQGIPPFADATARDAAITAPADGEHAYLTGSDTLMEYQTSAWVIINEPKQTWTPTISQPGSITKTVNWGYSQRQGGMYRATCKLSITGSGTATNPIIVTTPFTHVEQLLPLRQRAAVLDDRVLVRDRLGRGPVRHRRHRWHDER
jgi:hypothetical protein